MSNLSQDHPSIRVHAPPGGHSSNIFGSSEFEQSAANKKKHMGSDIFGSKQDTNDFSTAKPTRQAGNNIFGTESDQPASKSHMHVDKNKSSVFEESTPKPSVTQESNTKAATLAGQYKQTQMKSSIFGNDEPSATRAVSDKNKSNIFGVCDQDEQKRQGGGRHGLRDPNASRMGYNPINGEAYSAKENPTDSPIISDQSNGNAQVASATSNENANSPVVTDKTANAHDQTTNGNNAQKNVHTSVRVFHPPGGRSNGPLW